MVPRLSILIATHGRREIKFSQLLFKLMKQANHFRGQIEVIAYWNTGELPIGEIRQKLLKEAQGEYVCFIDDDDDIPEYYCREIIKALGKDYVGFKVQFFSNGVEGKPVYHDLQYQVWTEDNKGFYRGITHLNPIKREIALQGNFSLNGAGEDADWARSIISLVKDQNYIDKVMYCYYHDQENTSFGGSWRYQESGYRRPPLEYKNFRWHPDSLLKSKEVV